MGDREKAKAEGCEDPDQCKGHPWECDAEQIRKCHGEVEKHPCVNRGEGK